MELQLLIPTYTHINTDPMDGIRELFKASSVVAWRLWQHNSNRSNRNCKMRLISSWCYADFGLRRKMSAPSSRSSSPLSVLSRSPSPPSDWEEESGPSAEGSDVSISSARFVLVLRVIGPLRGGDCYHRHHHHKCCSACPCSCCRCRRYERYPLATEQSSKTQVAPSESISASRVTRSMMKSSLTTTTCLSKSAVSCSNPLANAALTISAPTTSYVNLATLDTAPATTLTMSCLTKPTASHSNPLIKVALTLSAPNMSGSNPAPTIVLSGMPSLTKPTISCIDPFINAASSISVLTLS
ncbi:hypothetical protein BJX61DRAFT_364144 [Aspergillus egyptiacus]|nr:hypothetical protein BJX61DRAFT_364144 [Aspergillus egyptiacus]